MQSQYSINRASVELERTSRTIRRALRDVPPDSHEYGQPRWRLNKIIGALNRNADRPTDRNYQGDPETIALIDDIERGFQLFNKAIARLEAEPNVELRRKLDLQTVHGGKLITGLDRKLQIVLENTGEQNG